MGRFLALVVLSAALSAVLVPTAHAVTGDVSVACTGCVADLHAAWNLDNRYLLFLAEAPGGDARGAVLYRTDTDTRRADRTEEVTLAGAPMNHVHGVAALARKRVLFSATVDGVRMVVLSDGDSQHTYSLHEGNRENWTRTSGNLDDVFVWLAENDDGLHVVYATDGTREHTIKIFDLHRLDQVSDVFRFRARVFIALERAEGEPMDHLRGVEDARALSPRVLVETDGTAERSRVFLTLPEGQRFVDSLARDHDDGAVFFFVQNNATASATVRTDVWMTRGSVADTQRLPLQLRMGQRVRFWPERADPVLVYEEQDAATLTLRSTTGRTDDVVIAFPPHVTRVQFVTQSAQRLMWIAHSAEHEPELYSYDGAAVVRSWVWPASQPCTIDADGTGRTVLGYAEWVFFVCAEAPRVLYRTRGHADTEPLPFADLTDIGLAHGTIHSLAWADRHVYVSYRDGDTDADSKVLALDSGVKTPPRPFGSAPPQRAPVIAVVVLLLAAVLAAV